MIDSLPGMRAWVVISFYDTVVSLKGYNEQFSVHLLFVDA